MAVIQWHHPSWITFTSTVYGPLLEMWQLGCYLLLSPVHLRVTSVAQISFLSSKVSCSEILSRLQL